MIYSPRAFFLLAQNHFGVNDDRSFRAHFGASIDVASVTWDRIRDNRTCPRAIKPIYLMWGLYFLKVYGTTEVMANKCGTSCNTFRKWVWIVLRQIQKLKRRVVSMKFSGSR